MSMSTYRRRGALAAVLVGSFTAASVLVLAGPASAVTSANIYVGSAQVDNEFVDMFAIGNPRSEPAAYGNSTEFPCHGVAGVELFSESSGVSLEEFTLIPGYYSFESPGVSFSGPMSPDPASFSSVFGVVPSVGANIDLFGLDAPSDDFPYYSTVRFVGAISGVTMTGLVSFDENGVLTAIADFTPHLGGGIQDDPELAIASLGDTMWVWFDDGVDQEIRTFPVTNFATAPVVGAASQVTMDAFPDGSLPAPFEADFEPGGATALLTFTVDDGGMGLAEIDYSNPTTTTDEADGYPGFNMLADVVPAETPAVSVLAGARAPAPSPGGRPGLAATGDDGDQMLLIAGGATAIVGLGLMVLALTRRRRRS